MFLRREEKGVTGASWGLMGWRWHQQEAGILFGPLRGAHILLWDATAATRAVHLQGVCMQGSFLTQPAPRHARMHALWPARRDNEAVKQMNWRTKRDINQSIGGDLAVNQSCCHISPVKPVWCMKKVRSKRKCYYNLFNTTTAPTDACRPACYCCKTLINEYQDVASMSQMFKAPGLRCLHYTWAITIISVVEGNSTFPGPYKNLMTMYSEDDTVNIYCILFYSIVKQDRTWLMWH